MKGRITEMKEHIPKKLTLSGQEEEQSFEQMSFQIPLTTKGSRGTQVRKFAFQTEDKNVPTRRKNPSEAVLDIS